MAFITLHEALDRVLEKLAVEREGKEAGGVEPPAKYALAEGRITERGNVHGSTARAKPRKAEKQRARMPVMR